MNSAFGKRGWGFGASVGPRSSDTGSPSHPHGVSQPLYTICGMCLPVGVNVWHASVNTVHKLRIPRSLAPAGTDEAPGRTVSLCGAVAVACTVLRLLPLHAGGEEGKSILPRATPCYVGVFQVTKLVQDVCGFSCVRQLDWSDGTGARRLIFVDPSV